MINFSVSPVNTSNCSANASVTVVDTSTPVRELIAHFDMLKIDTNKKNDADGEVDGDENDESGQCLCSLLLFNSFANINNNTNDFDQRSWSLSPKKNLLCFVRLITEKFFVPFLTYFEVFFFFFSAKNPNHVNSTVNTNTSNADTTTPLDQPITTRNSIPLSDQVNLTQFN